MECLQDGWISRFVPFCGGARWRSSRTIAVDEVAKNVFGESVNLAKLGDQVSEVLIGEQRSIASYPSSFSILLQQLSHSLEWEFVTSHQSATGNRLAAILEAYA